MTAGAKPFIEFKVRRFNIVSGDPFEAVIKRLTDAIGHPDTAAFHRALATASSGEEVERIVEAAVGPSGLMEFAQFDAGGVIVKRFPQRAMRSIRFLVGNPIIMADMARTVPDAAAYAPVTVLIDERGDGVHLAYDSMSSLLAPYASDPALKTAKALDEEIFLLLGTAAGVRNDDTGSDPIEETNSLSSVDFILRGSILDDW